MACPRIPDIRLPASSGSRERRVEMNARDYLYGEIEREARTQFGIRDREYLKGVADTWMDDSRDPNHRFDTISSLLPEARRILDMASGCGTCLFYGLKNGYDMYGVDPEKWKCKFALLKASELRYPGEWVSRFSRAVGENLPFSDSTFDCVTTYQTLEHVGDVRKTVTEMIRVTKPGGGVHIHCPDYRSTFEGHYRLPWLPLLPRTLARIYLRALGRPIAGLLGIQYVTRRGLAGILRALARETPSLKIKVTDVDRIEFSKARGRRFSLGLTGTYVGYQAVRYLRSLFKRDIASNLFVYVIEK